MILQSFLEAYNGRYIDFDGYYGAQCMDLMHQYCVEVLGITDGGVLAADCAKNVYLNFSSIKGNELFEQIGNTPTNTPQEGDIMFWGNSTYGHVAIYISGDVNSFMSFDQNFPTGSFCHAQNHTYTNVLGWLRYKGKVEENYQVIIDELRADRDKNWNLYQGSLQKQIELESAVESKQKSIDSLTKDNVLLKETVDSLITEKQGLSTSLQELKNTNSVLTGKNDELIIDLTNCTKDLQKCQKGIPIQSFSKNQLLSELIRQLFRKG